jgi:hypothetical protein
LVIGARHREVVVTLAAEVDESDASKRVADLAPTARRLAQLAFSVYPDLQSRFAVDFRVHPAST